MCCSPIVSVSQCKRGSERAYVMLYYEGARVRVLPEAACSIAQHLGGMKVELAVVMVIGGGVPVGVGYDDAIGQNSQRVLDDWHLQGVT